MRIIPDTDGFTIDRNRVVRDPEGEVKNTYINGDGYITCSVRKPDKRWVTYGIHRLYMLAYHYPHGKDPALLTVNHLDKDVTNNEDDNLEWASTKLNNLHATVLLNRFNKRPLIKCERVKDQQISYFDDLTSAAEYFNEPIETVWNRFKDNKEIDGCLLTHLSYRDAFGVRMKSGKHGLENKKIRPCKVINIIDNTETKYPSVYKAGEALDMNYISLHTCYSNRNSYHVIHGKWLIMDEDEDTSNLTEHVISTLLNRGKKKVVSFNIQNKVTTIYESAAQFIKNNNLSKKAVTTRLKRGVIQPVKDFIFVYDNEDQTAFDAMVRSYQK